MKTIGFVALGILLIFFQSIKRINAEENVVDPKLGERICKLFNEAKCTYDDYCYINKKKLMCLTIIYISGDF